jgi:hypothetical protein
MTSDEAPQILVEAIGPSLSSTDPALRKLESGTAAASGWSSVARTYEQISSHDIQNAITTVASAVMTAIRSLNPQACEVEFHIGFKAGARVPVIASGEANGSLKVTLKWSSAEDSRSR